jgi:hypothetical protein
VKRYLWLLLALCPTIAADAQMITRTGGRGSAAVAVPTMASTGLSSFADPQETATLADTAAGLRLTDVGQGGVNKMRTVCKAAPAIPYTVAGKISMSVGFASNTDQWAGLTWRNTGPSGTTNEILAGLIMQGATNELAANTMVNYTTWTGASLTTVSPWYSTDIWFQLKDDGTTVTESYGSDGVAFHQMFSLTKSDSFLGATGYNLICFYINPKGFDTSATLESYKETSP